MNEVTRILSAIAQGAPSAASQLLPLVYDDLRKQAAQQPVERVNYDTNLEGVTVNGGNQPDRFFVDDTRARITLNGGAGNDFFQIGQLYQTQRTASPDTNIAASDGFATIDTTDGWLSNGISDPMTINGSDDDDTFIVFHNLAVLNLNGQAGNDTFVVQAFALVGSKDDARAITDISGGAGADLVQYAVDAPVNIDGGDGFDTVIIIGTEFADDFVFTNKGVFGAGLNVNYVNVEHLVVDGGAGNDRFFIDGTAENMVTEVDGGLGSDLFSIGGPTPGNGVISKNLKGHSGIISTNVVSSDLGSAYNGIDAQGVGVNVADNDEPAVMVTPARGTPMVVQNDPVYGIDSYTVVLSRPPLPGHTVTITAVPPQGLLVTTRSTCGCRRRLRAARQ